MPIFVLHNCDGARANETFHSSPAKLDNGTSRVFSKSFFVNLTEHGESIAKLKDSDDKIVIGYTRFGLPFQLVVDGFFGSERAKIFSFIDQSVVPLIETFAEKLNTDPENATNIMDNLVKEIFHRREFEPFAEFTLSLALTYPMGDEIYCAGFGIGDTGLVIKRQTGLVEQLVFHTEVDEFKDAFDSYSAQNIQEVIHRNTLFNTPVQPGDQIVGYTFLPKPLEIEIERPDRKKSNSVKPSIRYLALDTSTFTTKGDLYSQLLQQMERSQEELITKAKASHQRTKFGDDCSIGAVVVPDIELRKELQQQLLLLEVKTLLQEYKSVHNRQPFAFLNRLLRLDTKSKRLHDFLNQSESSMADLQTLLTQEPELTNYLKATLDKTAMIVLNAQLGLEIGHKLKK